MLPLIYQELQFQSEYNGVLLIGKIELGENKYHNNFSTRDILIGGHSLFDTLKFFFEIECKFYWSEIFDTNFTFAVQFVMSYEKDFRYLCQDCGGGYEWINGNKGFESVMTTNDNLFELLSEHIGKYLIIKI